MRAPLSFFALAVAIAASAAVAQGPVGTAAGGLSEVPDANGECVAVDVPYDCCSGIEVGTCTMADLACDTVANASCAGFQDPFFCCSASASGTCPANFRQTRWDAATDIFYRCNGSAWVPHATASDSDSLTISQTAHGFLVGDWIMFNAGTAQWELLDVASYATLLDVSTSGYVTAVGGANSFDVAINGTVLGTHGLPLGALYGSTTPGVATSSRPGVGALYWRIADAVSSTALIVSEEEWYQR